MCLKKKKEGCRRLVCFPSFLSRCLCWMISSASGTLTANSTLPLPGAGLLHLQWYTKVQRRIRFEIQVYKRHRSPFRDLSSRATCRVWTDQSEPIRLPPNKAMPSRPPNEIRGMAVGIYRFLKFGSGRDYFLNERDWKRPYNFVPSARAWRGYKE